MNFYKLNKTKIKTGLNCHKQLWFDINESIIKDNFNFHKGKVFEKQIKNLYGKGFDLSNNEDQESINLTYEAINNPKINIIYEGAFIFFQTLVRVDVLIRNNQGWKLIEIKSSSSVKNDHLKDIAIQNYILTKLKININENVIAYLNKDFIYKGDLDYENIFIEEDVTNKIKQYTEMVPKWIDELLPVTEEKNIIPSVEIGDHCKNCNYIDRCNNEKFFGVDVPISILPIVGNKLQNEWYKHKIYDLKDLPISVLNKKNLIQIQKCHKEGIEWIDKSLINQINNYPWPRYFFDVETIMQGVPLISNTKPNDQFPFQFSVHKWEYENQILTLNDSQSFLEFAEEGMERRFLLSLITKLGDEGPIFAHNSSTEIKAIKYLSSKVNCLDLKPHVDAISNRIIDTAKMMRNGFYNPLMMGSYSLKNLVKVLPNGSKYSKEGNSVGDGGDAMISWFEYTKPNSTYEQKALIKKNLIKYCAQDTLNLYLLFKYILCRNVFINSN